MPSLRDLVNQSQHELNAHAGDDVDDAQDALDTIDAHARGETTAEDPDELIRKLEIVDGRHPAMEIPTASLREHFDVLTAGDQDDDVDVDALEDLTHDQLYELAQDHDVTGRSSMDKAELVDALEDAGADPAEA